MIIWISIFLVILVVVYSERIWVIGAVRDVLTPKECLPHSWLATLAIPPNASTQLSSPRK